MHKCIENLVYHLSNNLQDWNQTYFSLPYNKKNNHYQDYNLLPINHAASRVTITYVQTVYNYVT